MIKEKEYTRFVKDPIMEPYFISIDDHCVTVNISITPDARYTDSVKEYTKIIGHYSNMGSALRTIIKNKINNHSYDSLKEYMNEYNSLTEVFGKTFNI